MHRRHVLATVASLCLASLALPAAAQPGPPRLSPNASVSQTVGVTEITIHYCRPAVNGRKIWGGLVPMDQVWRTGANEATTFTASTDVMVEGKPLPAGNYALFTIPGQDHWTLIFNKTADQWGAFDYQQAEDVLRVELKPVQSGMQERMEFLVDEFNDSSATIVLRWENVAVPFTVSVDTPKQAVAKAERELAGEPKANAMISWARWLQEHDLAADKALAWVQRATATADGAKSYWGKAVEARLLAKSGKASAARTAATAAIELAKTQQGGEGVANDAKKLGEEMAAWGK
jgi:hypothetical protein